ncbi:cytochrome b561 domain-containing protein [Pigmentiphaga sp. GD03639]|jgi:hypothetical protein|uniref:cytochrome b561 domain-containing protein n=1 Tax=unclassified Pigmentiphaga TaxID=2626614 RepID=UPI0020CF02CB|nr:MULTISPECIES: cytochrome b561 domain-containing protein [unclassified Pigmentiphaga]MDH2240050.1 cytochrome b561 domain-containing protein [Pigmentiphaga sp. GD03639]
MNNDPLGRGPLLPGPGVLAGAGAAILVALAVLAWVAGADALAWLQQSMVDGRPHRIDMAQAWHARAMVLAWAVMIPLGILAARFFKVMPRQAWPAALDNKCWWHAHLALQIGGVLATTGAVALVWQTSGSDTGLARVHRASAWATCALAALQVLGGMLRGSKGNPDEPGDHYDMTGRRVVFEAAHKLAGYLALAVAAVAIVTGLLYVNAPRWMPVLIGAWSLAWAGAFAWLQCRGWCIDTYQAIWGADPRHPGNRRPPIGPGIRQLRASGVRSSQVGTPPAA